MISDPFDVFEPEDEPEDQPALDFLDTEVHDYEGETNEA